MKDSVFRRVKIVSKSSKQDLEYKRQKTKRTGILLRAVHKVYTTWIRPLELTPIRENISSRSVSAVGLGEGVNLFEGSRLSRENFSPYTYQQGLKYRMHTVLTYYLGHGVSS